LKAELREIARLVFLCFIMNLHSSLFAVSEKITLNDQPAATKSAVFIEFKNSK
jgi:hypothetical protein